MLVLQSEEMGDFVSHQRWISACKLAAASTVKFILTEQYVGSCGLSLALTTSTFYLPPSRRQRVCIALTTI